MAGHEPIRLGRIRFSGVMTVIVYIWLFIAMYFSGRAYFGGPSMRIIPRPKGDNRISTNHVTFSPDGESLAVAYGWEYTDAQGLICIWDANSGSRVLKKILNEYNPISIEYGSTINEVRIIGRRFSRGNLARRPGDTSRFVCEYEYRMCSMSVGGDSEVVTLGTWSDVRNVGVDRYLVVFSPMGNEYSQVPNSNANTIQVRNINNGELLREMNGHEDPILSILYYPEGVNLISCSAKSTRIWNASNGEERRATDEGYSSVAITSNGGQLALGGGENGNIYFISESQWRRKGSLDSGSYRVHALTYSSDGQYLLSAAYDGQPGYKVPGYVRLWNVESRECVWEYRHGESYALTMAYSPTREMFAVGYSSGEVIICEMPGPMWPFILFLIATAGYTFGMIAWKIRRRRGVGPSGTTGT